MEQDISTFRVHDISGPHCVTVEDGQQLFDRTISILKSGGKICLDFDGVLTVTSSFLNASVGRLVGRLGPQDFDRLVAWQNLDQNDSDLLKLVIRNAREHFEKPENAQRIEDNIVGRTDEEV